MPYFRLFFIATSVGLLLSHGLTQPVFGAKGNETVYQNPFDIAAGGASLTRASREGLVFSNPALLPLGDATVRWFGTQIGAIVGSSILKLGEETDDEIANSTVDSILDENYHIGQSMAVSFVSSNFAISVFDRVEFDFEGQKYGDGGLPALAMELEAYGGGLLSFASRPYPWLSLGLTGKYLYVAEPSVKVPVADQSEIQRIVQNPEELASTLNFGNGLGADAAALLFFRDYHVDWSLALKVDDIGNTPLSGREPFKQTVSAGLGLAFHGTTEVLHLGLDYRDLFNAYDERLFKKIYTGARLLLRQTLGFAVGFYQGLPTYGINLELLFLNVGFTAYGRELGNYPGEKQRNLYYVHFGLGF